MNSAFSKLRCVLTILILALACSAPRAIAAAVILHPVADTSLLEINPTNNLGGFPGMNAGTTQEYRKTRALLRFDLTSLPTNAVILSAALQLEVTRDPDEPANNSTFGLHRMLRPWGEGDKSPVAQPGKGLPATPGEATWECAFHPTNTWTVPGGAPDVDFSSIESSSQFIYGTGESPYRFETTPELVADVAAWLHNPAANFGWMLLCNEEFSNFTARRFGTREDPNNPPILELQYLLPPQIDSLKQLSGQYHLWFVARTGQSYEIQFCHSFSSNHWQALARTGPFAQDTQVLVIDTVSAPQRFYRLNTW